MLNFDKEIEDVRKVFEEYSGEKMEEERVVFYLPADGKDEKNKEPILTMSKNSIFEQNGFFSLFLYRCLIKYNQIFLSSKILGLDSREKERIVADRYIPYFLERNKESFMGHTIGFPPNFLSARKVSKTSLALHLIQEFEYFLKKEPDEEYLDMKKVHYKDWEKHTCLQVGDIKFVNLKSYVMDFLNKIKNFSAGQIYGTDENGKEGVPIKTIVFRDVLFLLEEALYDAFTEAKKEIEKGGFLKYENHLNRQANGNINIPQPKPKKQGGGKRRK